MFLHPFSTPAITTTSPVEPTTTIHAFCLIHSSNKSLLPVGQRRRPLEKFAMFCTLFQTLPSLPLQLSPTTVHAFRLIHYYSYNTLQMHVCVFLCMCKRDREGRIMYYKKQVCKSVKSNYLSKTRCFAPFFNPCHHYYLSS